MCFTEPWTSVRETLDRLKAEAIADVDAEGCTAPEDMYKKPVLCAAHVVSIGDPVYRKRLESVQAMHRKLEDWNVRLQSDQPGYPVYHGNHGLYNSQELNNKALQRQREKEKKELKDEIRSYQEDRRNAQEMLAQDMLAYERAKFQADCAARNIRTTEDVERAYIRIAVARADVVS